jgi:hypothetical protein
VASSARRHGSTTAYLGRGGEGDGGVRTVDDWRLQTGGSEWWRSGRGVSRVVGMAVRSASDPRCQGGGEAAEASVGLSGRQSGRGHALSEVP